MPNLVTLAKLSERVRRQLDIHTGGGETWQDEQGIIDALDQHLGELYDLLIAAYGMEYALAPGIIPTVAGQLQYALPKNFYKMVRVDVLIDGKRLVIEPFSWASETIDTQQRPWTSSTRIRYRFFGLGTTHDDHPRSMNTDIAFMPVPNGVYAVNLLYVPVFPGLTKTRRFDDVNGWSWFAVYGACADIAARQEQDPTYYLGKQEAYRIRLSKVAGQRDIGGIERVHDLKAVRRRRAVGRLF